MASNTAILIDEFSTTRVHAVKPNLTEGTALPQSAGGWGWTVTVPNSFSYTGTQPDRATAVNAMLAQMVNAT